MQNNELFKEIVEKLHDGLYFVDLNRQITYWNKAAEKITGFSAEEVVGKKCSDNILTHMDKDGVNLCKTACPLAKSINDLNPRESELYLHHKDGHRVPVSVRVNPMLDETGTAIGGFEIFSDLTNEEAIRARISELEKLSYIDKLTQLCNRTYLEVELQSLIDEYHKTGVEFGLLFIDIDNFKRFNDTYGHETGDDVLKMVSKTFSSNCRPFDVYGRWGGEEFIGIIRNINLKRLEILGNRMRHLVGNSYIIIDNEKISVSISLGGTVINNKDTIKSIVSRADEQLYISKEAGRNRLTLI